MVRAQMLSELEEIIAYKQYADQPERQQTMRKTWMKRLGSLILSTLSDTHWYTDYKGVNQTLKCGNASCKYEHLS